MKYLSVLVLLILSATGFANVPPKNLNPKVAIESSSLHVMEQEGELVLITSDGRFVMRGTLVDAWHKKELKNITEVQYAIEHVDTDKMGIKFDELNTITLGEGPKRVVIFVDPLCSGCKSVLETAKTKTKEYTFKIVVVPALGKKSNVLAKNLFCAKTKDKAFDYLMSNKLHELEQKTECPSKMYDMTMLWADFMKVRQVPFFISPDGRKKPGVGEAIWEWLKDEA